MEALRHAFQHLYDHADPSVSFGPIRPGEPGNLEWHSSREEAEILLRAVLQTIALIEAVVESQIVRMCNVEGLDSSRIIPPRRSQTQRVNFSGTSVAFPMPAMPLVSLGASQSRSSGGRSTFYGENHLSHACSCADYDSSYRTSELRDVYLQALGIMRFLILLHAKAGCEMRGLNPRTLLGSSCGFADLDNVLLNSLSHTLFRIPLTASAMQALKAYPVSLARQLLRDLRAIKRGSFLPLLFSILVVGGGRKNQVGYELGRSARVFVGYLLRQNGVCLHMADPALREDQMLGAAKFDQMRWNRRELDQFDAIVLLSRPSMLDMTLLDDIDVGILEELD